MRSQRSIKFKANADTALLIKCDKRMDVQFERVWFLSFSYNVAGKRNEPAHSHSNFVFKLSVLRGLIKLALVMVSRQLL